MAHRCTKKACWKCGQQVSHYRRVIYRARRFGQSLVPVEHYVEKRGRQVVCLGTGVSK